MKVITSFLALFIFSYPIFCQGSNHRPRIVISSDFPPVDVIPGTLGYGAPEKRSDPDDIQSMVRFLVYSNEFEILGLIAASGTLANIANKQHIFDIIDIYDKVDDNLRRHDPGYPLPNDLKKVTRQGLSGTYSKPWKEIIGEGKDSEASNYLINLLKQPDPAPLWFCFWGGTQELAQALWGIKQSEPKQLKAIISKIRVFMIDQQDGTGQWLIDNFPDIKILVMKNAYKDFSYNGKGADKKLGDSAWVNKHIRNNHGPLGAIYPESGWDHTKKGVIEGDTPSFLYVLSGVMGLSDPEKPWYGGWGGRFKADSIKKNCWVDSDKYSEAINRWQYSRQNDFEARMDWCVKSFKEANHSPLIEEVTVANLVKPGQKVKLKASATDPDGDKISYWWWHYPDPSGMEQSIKIVHKTSKNAYFIVPPTAKKDVHIILEVSDDGTPTLKRYKRLVFKIGK